MRYLGVCTSLLLALGIAPAAARPERTEAFAEPSDIIAAEGAFQHLRQQKGAQAAIHATAQDDAQIYTTELKRVSDILKTRNDKSLPPAWQPQKVWMSCDGSYAVSYGAWQEPPRLGWFATVWHRQKNGAYKWVLDAGDTLISALPEPEMIAASVADCPVRHARKAIAAPADHPRPSDYTMGHADDGTLAWSVTSDSGGTVGFVAQLKQNGAMRQVLHVGGAPPGA